MAHVLSDASSNYMTTRICRLLGKNSFLAWRKAALFRSLWHLLQLKASRFSSIQQNTLVNTAVDKWLAAVVLDNNLCKFNCNLNSDQMTGAGSCLQCLE